MVWDWYELFEYHATTGAKLQGQDAGLSDRFAHHIALKKVAFREPGLKIALLT